MLSSCVSTQALCKRPNAEPYEKEGAKSRCHTCACFRVRNGRGFFSQGLHEFVSEITTSRHGAATVLRYLFKIDIEGPFEGRLAVAMKWPSRDPTVTHVNPFCITDLRGSLVEFQDL